MSPIALDFKRSGPIIDMRLDHTQSFLFSQKMELFVGSIMFAAIGDFPLCPSKRAALQSLDAAIMGGATTLKGSWSR